MNSIKATADTGCDAGAGCSSSDWRKRLRAGGNRWADRSRPCVQDGARRHRVEAQGLDVSLWPLAGNPAAPAVKREAEEDWRHRR
jgi:hypothetical protein